MGMPNPRNIKRQQAITDLIESIALEEEAIAVILDAQGEELQKIVKSNCPVELIFKANKSVEDVVKTLTRFEYLLECKLDLFRDCLCEEDRHHHDYDEREFD